MVRAGHLADHLTAIATGTANQASFTFDALGRFATRTISGTVDTYSYVGTSETVARITTGGTTTDSIVSPAGDRLGVKVGATLNWFLPDLHGDVAGSLDASEATVVNAIRYDAYGQTITTGSAGAGAVGEKAWKYQGRLDVSPTALGTPLYDMSARFYSPGAGVFTQLDSSLGGAQDPLSMNRFLYAEANPATLIDPTGHDACAFDCDSDYDNGGRSQGNHDVNPGSHESQRDHDSGSGPATRQRDDRRNDERETFRISSTNRTPKVVPYNQRITPAEQRVGSGNGPTKPRDPDDIAGGLGRAVCNVTVCGVTNLINGLASNPVYTLNCFLPDSPCQFDMARHDAILIVNGSNADRAEVIGTLGLSLALAFVGAKGGGAAGEASLTPMQDAVVARDAAGAAAEARPGQPPAAFVGIQKDGDIAVGVSQRGGIHAEDSAESQLSGGQFTKVYGWRGSASNNQRVWTEIPVCVNCQAKFERSRFPSDVLYDADGPWGR